jgi:dihydrofolate reductase
MGHVIVTGFVSLDGIVTDPDGSGGTPAGGWAFRHGPETVGGDKFRLGELMDSGVLLLGRTTWELFSRLWPNRTDDFSLRMNKMAKVVASHSLTDLSAFPNSTLMEGSLTDYVRTESRTIAVTGSRSGRRVPADDLPVGRRHRREAVRSVRRTRPLPARLGRPDRRGIVGDVRAALAAAVPVRG